MPRRWWRGPQIVYGGRWGWPPAMPIPYYAPVVDSNQQQQNQQQPTQASILGIDNKTMLLLTITAVAVYWWATKRRS